jgi:hypothetical protein
VVNVSFEALVNIGKTYLVVKLRPDWPVDAGGVEVN